MKKETLLQILRDTDSIEVTEDGKVHYSLPLLYRMKSVNEKMKVLFAELSLNNLNLYLELNRITEDEVVDEVTRDFMEYIGEVQKAVDHPEMYIEPSYSYHKYKVKIATAYVSPNNFDEAALEAVAEYLEK